MTQVEIKKFEKQEIYSIRRTTPINEMEKVIGELFVNIGKTQLQIVGPLFSIYYDEEFNPDNADYEVCVPVKGPKDQITNKVDGGDFAVINHKGSYENISESYTVIMGWIHQNGYDVVNPPNEVYLVGPTDTKNSDEYVTEIRFPVKKK